MRFIYTSQKRVYPTDTVHMYVIIYLSVTLYG